MARMQDLDKVPATRVVRFAYWQSWQMLRHVLPHHRCGCRAATVQRLLYHESHGQNSFQGDSDRDVESLSKGYQAVYQEF